MKINKNKIFTCTQSFEKEKEIVFRILTDHFNSEKFITELGSSTFYFKRKYKDGNSRIDLIAKGLKIFRRGEVSLSEHSANEISINISIESDFLIVNSLLLGLMTGFLLWATNSYNIFISSIASIISFGIVFLAGYMIVVTRMNEILKYSTGFRITKDKKM